VSGYDHRGLRAVCIECRRPFYIPWETMCDAGVCDPCMAERAPRRPVATSNGGVSLPYLGGDDE
jgi:hypothetical protein